MKNFYKLFNTILFLITFLLANTSFADEYTLVNPEEAGFCNQEVFIKHTNGSFKGYISLIDVQGGSPEVAISGKDKSYSAFDVKCSGNKISLRGVNRAYISANSSNEEVGVRYDSSDSRYFYILQSEDKTYSFQSVLTQKMLKTDGKTGKLKIYGRQSTVNSDEKFEIEAESNDVVTTVRSSSNNEILSEICGKNIEIRPAYDDDKKLVIDSHDDVVIGRSGDTDFNVECDGNKISFNSNGFYLIADGDNASLTKRSKDRQFFYILDGQTGNKTFLIQNIDTNKLLKGVIGTNIVRINGSAARINPDEEFLISILSSGQNGGGNTGNGGDGDGTGNVDDSTTETPGKIPEEDFSFCSKEVYITHNLANPTTGSHEKKCVKPSNDGSVILGDVDERCTFNISCSGNDFTSFKTPEGSFIEVISNNKIIIGDQPDGSRTGPQNKLFRLKNDRIDNAGDTKFYLESALTGGLLRASTNGGETLRANGGNGAINYQEIFSISCQKDCGTVIDKKPEDGDGDGDGDGNGNTVDENTGDTTSYVASYAGSKSKEGAVANRDTQSGEKSCDIGSGSLECIGVTSVFTFLPESHDAYNNNKVTQHKDTESGDLLLLFIHINDNAMTRDLSGWETIASCEKSNNDDTDCSNIRNANTDLGVVAYYKRATDNGSRTHELGNLPGTDTNIWSFLVTLRGAADPITRNTAVIGTDGFRGAKFPQPNNHNGSSGDILFMSMSYDDGHSNNQGNGPDRLLSKDHFTAPSDSSRIGYVLRNDEAAFLFNKRLRSSSSNLGNLETQGRTTYVDRSKDAMLTVIIKAE